MRQKEEGPKAKDDSTRKTASVVTMVLGIPNLILSLLSLLVGVIASAVLIVILVALIVDDQGKGDAWAAFFIILFIILIIFALIALVVIIAILMALAFALSSQVIGGILAFRGRRFALAVSLMVLGAGLTFILGGIMLIFGVIFGINDKILAMLPLLLWGGYNIFSSIVTGICTGVVVSRKRTFVQGKTIKLSEHS